MLAIRISLWEEGGETHEGKPLLTTTWNDRRNAPEKNTVTFNARKISNHKGHI